MEEMKGTKLARRGINDLIEYIPGKPVEEVKKEYGLTQIIKLASNENPLGTSPKAIEAMKRAVEDAYIYPEGSSRSLRQRIASTYKIDEDMVILSNGADNILTIISHAFLNDGEEVIMGDPSFSVYETVTKIMGGVVIKVALTDFTYDLPSIAGRISDKTKLIFICNPNNPTGTIVTQEQVERFMESIPSHCIVIFDEAYAEFADKNSYPQTIKYVFDQRNVIIVRTFSKLYGLAGIRVGYAIAPKSLISTLRKVVEPFPVNRIAQAGALAAYDDADFIEKVLKVNEKGKKYLFAQLPQLGMTCVPTAANFILVNLGMDSKFVFQRLLEQGVVIRPGGIWGLPEYARITIGTQEDNEKLINALKNIKSNS